MGQLVQLDNQSQRIKGLIAVNQQRMIRAAPRNVDPNRLLAIAFNAIAYNTDLLVCSEVSLIGGIMESLKLGLTLGGPMQEAWLIPFNDNRSATGKTATLIVGYQGYRILIDRSRSVLDLHPRAVHNGDGRPGGVPDEFDYEYGSNPFVRHRSRGSEPSKESELMAVYAVGRLRGGGLQFEVLDKPEVDRHRARSRARANGPWVTDYVPMALKTAIRKIAKYLPKASMEMARAMELDEKADMGEEQQFDVDGLVIEPAKETGPQPQARLEGLKDTLRQEKGKPAAATVPAELQADAINFGDGR